MLIGLCSDSHDHTEHIERAVAVFKEKKTDLVIHAGDYCSPFTIPLFSGLPLNGIYGNNDGDRYMLLKKFDEIGAELHGDYHSFEADGLKIAVYHGTYTEITEGLEQHNRIDVVISGHTHEGRVNLVDNTISINPGSIRGFDQDAMVALFDTTSKKVNFIEL